MGLLFAVVAVLQDDANASVVAVFVTTLLFFLLKLLAFGACCIVFSRYIEAPMIRFFQRIEPPPDAMLMMVSVAFIITALAGALGFSIAIGAFFAGLVFSRDPQAVHLEANQVFSAMVLVSAVTCLVSPFIMQALLRRWPQPLESPT